MMVPGTGGGNKADEFSEKFQAGFDHPPLIFGKSCCNFFQKNALKPCTKAQNQQYKFLDRK